MAAAVYDIWSVAHGPVKHQAPHVLHSECKHALKTHSHSTVHLKLSIMSFLVTLTVCSSLLLVDKWTVFALFGPNDF